MKKLKTQKGITLVALIITIIVLLILAVVAIGAVRDDGIIEYAKNARYKYEEEQAKEEQMLQNYLSSINISTSQITWTKISTGDLAIGSTVKTSTNEEFYVLGGDTVGTPITSSTEKVILLAKNNLEADGAVQDSTGEINACVFSATANFTEGENLNNNSTIKADKTSAVYKAMKYGETLGVTTGRLLTVEEVEALAGSSTSTSGCNTNGYGWINSSVYWLGSAKDNDQVRVVHGGNARVMTPYYNNAESIGVRPVVEILKSNIS